MNVNLNCGTYERCRQFCYSVCVTHKFKMCVCVAQLIGVPALRLCTVRAAYSSGAHHFYSADDTTCHTKSEHRRYPSVSVNVCVGERETGRGGVERSSQNAHLWLSQDTTVQGGLRRPSSSPLRSNCVRLYYQSDGSVMRTTCGVSILTLHRECPPVRTAMHWTQICYKGPTICGFCTSFLNVSLDKGVC